MSFVFWGVVVGRANTCTQQGDGNTLDNQLDPKTLPDSVVPDRARLRKLGILFWKVPSERRHPSWGTTASWAPWELYKTTSSLVD